MIFIFSYLLAALIRKILFLPLENRIHILAPPCNIIYITTYQAVAIIIDHIEVNYLIQSLSIMFTCEIFNII